MARRTKPQPTSHYDGWNSVATGLGTSRDRRTTHTFEAPRLTYEMLRELYRGDDMAARIVDLLPSEMMRKSFDVAVKSKGDGQRDKAVAEAVTDRLDELGAAAAVEQALQWARAFGGSGILLGANDMQRDLWRPLSLDRVASLDFLTVFNARELQAERYYTDPAHPKFGHPATYRIHPLVQSDDAGRGPVVHESRLLTFHGTVVSREQLRENLGWGDSTLVRVYEVLRDFGSAWGGAGHLMTDFAQGVLTIPGLNELLASKGGQAALEKRLGALELMRSLVRAVVADGGTGPAGRPPEQFDRKQSPVSGLADLLDKFSLRLAAAARTPVTLLMGQAPAGLNATGDTDVRWFSAQAASAQEKELRPQLNRLVKVLFRSASGPTKGKEPESWRVVFPPLWELTALEKADLRLKTSQADQLDIQGGVLDPAEVAISRYGGDEYSTETHLDMETRETMAPAASEPEPEPEPLP